MTIKLVSNTILTLIILAAFTACGGGGGGSGGGTTAQTATTITAQPTDQSVVAGTTATLNVVASNATGYQWQRSTDGGANFIDVTAATAAGHTSAVTTLADSGTQYRVAVSGASNSVTSSAVTLTVMPAIVAPSISVQPTGQTITEGQNAQFTVVVSGTPTPTLQWQLSSDNGVNWSDITGATGTVFNVTGAALANNGRQFRAVASNSAGVVNSNAATLTVNPGSPLANIVFGRQSGLQGDLFLIKEDGSGEIALADTTDSESFLAIAPDGRVVYQRVTGGLINFYSVNADGTGTMPLVSAVSSADFPIFNGITPSGWVIYRRDTTTAGRDIYAVKADGTGTATIANTSGHDDFVTITASGKIIYTNNADLYSINADGTGKVTLAASLDSESFQGKTSAGQVVVARCNFSVCSHFSVNENGGAAILLTTDTFADEFSLYLGGITTTGQVIFRKSSSPNWVAGYQTDIYGSGGGALATSADHELYSGSTASGQVIYSRSTLIPNTSTFQYDLYIVNADGSNTIALANSTTSSESFNAVAPDGRIIYSSCTTVSSLCDLYAVNADGTGAVALANSATFQEFFAGITANGRVIYNRENGSLNNLFAVNTDGTGATQLPGGPFFVGNTPSGKVLIRNQNNGNANLYIVNADGTGSIPLANTGNNEFFAAAFP